MQRPGGGVGEATGAAATPVVPSAAAASARMTLDRMDTADTPSKKSSAKRIG